MIQRLMSIAASAAAFVAVLMVGITCTALTYEPEMPAELQAE